jgi:transcriptional regulator with XRE-family HTH domain
VPGIAYYESIRKEIIRLLRQEREHRRLSKYAIAQRSGVSESMVGLVERGLRNPSIELLLRLSDGVGVDLSEIIAKAVVTIKDRNQKQSRKDTHVA